MKRILLNTFYVLDRKERKSFFVLILLNVFISILDIIFLAFLIFLISFYTQGTANRPGIIYIKWFSDTNSILPISFFVLLFILKSIIGHIIFVTQFNYVYKVASRISRSNLLNYLRGSYADYVHTDSSVHVRKIMQQPIEFCHYVLSGLQQMITESVLSFFTIIAILMFNVKLFCLLALVLIPPLLIIAYVTKRKLRNARANVKISNEKTLQHLQEALFGYIESNIYDKTSFFTDRYSGYQEKLAQYLSDVQTSQGAPSRIIETFAVLGFFVLIFINKISGNSPIIEIINIGAFMAAAYKLIPGIVKISAASSQIKTYEFTVNELMVSKKSKTDDTHDYRSKIIKSIVLQNVFFKYNNNVILNSFNLHISIGDFVGIYGMSGKGKTTFIHLLLGFISEDEGTILINDVLVDSTERQQYWKNIAYVPQRPFLIHDTLVANITLSNDGINEEHLEEAIDISGLKTFIDGDSDKINVLITEGGKNISGGQRQRIALARALYKNADVIILDEPISELDAHSQHIILERLNTLAAKGKIIIMVTHNQENLLYCNKTCLID